MDIEEIKQQIIRIIKAKLDLAHYKVFLFGSRTNGQAGERSDIDIGIDAESKIPAKMLERIKGALETIPTLKKFDVVDFKDVSPEFKEVALQKTEVLYDR
jgi:predicted nucleotidyltransferase